MTLEEKIKKISIQPAESLLKPLNAGSVNDIKTFWENVIEPLLPDYATMEKWHKLLIEYVSLPDAVFMIRKGNEESKQYVESVPADALRRGFMTKTNVGYDFTYNDNDFATYMQQMVLDSDIVDTLTAKELLDYLKKPNSIIRFNQSGSGGVEKARAYYKIDGNQPRISKNGYTVAHIFDVNAHYYDKVVGFNNIGGEDALKSPNVKIDKGMYSDYKLQTSIAGKDIYYRENYPVGKDARRFLEAHMLRFLHPLNYFCAPKDNMKGYIYCEFTDFVNNGKVFSRRFKRISGYEHLLYYAHYKFKEKYSDIYDDFLKRIMLPANSFDFFENSVATTDYYGSEKIDIQYGNPLTVTSGTTSKVKLSSIKKNVKRKGSTMKNVIDLQKISKSYLQGFKACEIAQQVLKVIIEQGVINGTISKSNIDTFKSEKGKNTSTFMLTQPLLSLTITDKTGHKSYYVDPIVCYGETLYLNSQWGTDKVRKENLIDWIINWMVSNGSISKKHFHKKHTSGNIPRIIKGKEKTPCASVPQGEDTECWPIRYAQNVLLEEQVPQLCGRLKDEYYGILDFVKTIFYKHFNTNNLEAIPVILKKECPSRIYINDDDYVTEQINKLVKSGKTITSSETAKILRLEDRVAGEFVKQGPDAEGPYIAIYFNQYSANSWNDYIAKIVKTLAHEYAHYCEYVYCNEHLQNSYQDARVSEAIADFFGVLYSIKIGNIKIAEDRYNLWVKRFGSSWPYAYALCFYVVGKAKIPFTDYYLAYYDNGVIDKFIEVFLATPDAAIAFNKLVY